jgi:hypothetical protein
LPAMILTCAAFTTSGTFMHAAIGCESPPITAAAFLPSVGQVRKPGLNSVGLGGIPFFWKVSSTVLYQVPTFRILPASSAVATLRPNSLQRRGNAAGGVREMAAKDAAGSQPEDCRPNRAVQSGGAGQLGKQPLGIQTGVWIFRTAVWFFTANPEFFSHNIYFPGVQSLSQEPVSAFEGT